VIPRFNDKKWATEAGVCYSHQRIRAMEQGFSRELESKRRKRCERSLESTHRLSLNTRSSDATRSKKLCNSERSFYWESST